MNPTLIVAILGLCLAIAAEITGFYFGQRLAKADCEQARLASVERAIAQAHEQARIDTEILTAAAERQAAIQDRTRIITRTVTKHVEIPVYRECRLDACGLCLARSAARGDAGEDCPCGAADAMPAP